MASLPLASTTDRLVTGYLESPSSVLVLHGPSGVGKRLLAEQIIADILGVDYDKLRTYPYLIQVEPDGDSIKIEAIRAVQSALIRSVPGTRAVRRAVVIADAHKLTIEAQNALLKSLEEPPADTIFVLTVDNLQNLLSTVVSRAQPLAVLPISEVVAKAHFGDTPEVIRAFHMSGGRVALLQALLEDSEHPLLTAIDQAKDIISKSPYERLLLVNNLSKEKVATHETLDALLLLARISLNNSVKGDKNDQAKHWHAITKQVIAAEKALKANTSTKLVLTDLFLHL